MFCKGIFSIIVLLCLKVSLSIVGINPLELNFDCWFLDKKFVEFVKKE